MDTLAFGRDFFEQLKEQLLQPLPGFQAHLAMMNASRLDDYQRIKPDAKTRQSAVLVLFYPADTEWRMPMIVRPAYEGVHSGQVAFPGGKREAYDADLIATALREAEEEIGLDRNSVHILGSLTEIFVFASNFMLLPVVGYVSEKPVFEPDNHEVARILEIPVSQLFDKSRISETTIHLPNHLSLKTPYYGLQDEIVWGASAMVISELVSVLSAVKPK